MGFGMYEACCMRRIIALRLDYLKRRIKKMEFRITELPDVEHYYTELSQLEMEYDALDRTDRMLAGAIARSATFSEFSISMNDSIV